MSYLSRAACLLPVLAAAACAQPSAGSAQANSGNQLGYTGVVSPDATPAQTLAALRARPDVTIIEQRGWTVASDRANQTVWSFVPPGHPAYPAAVRRQIVRKDGAVLLDTKVLCGATKPVCDALVRDFQQLNQAVRSDLKG